MLSNATTDEDIEGAAIQMTEAMSLIQGQVDSGEITETMGALKKEQLAKGFAEQSFLNPILKAETSADAYAALEEMQDVPKGWNPQDWEKVVNKGLAHANKLARAEDQLLDAAAKMAENGALVDRGAFLFDNGIPVDPYKTTEDAKYNYNAVNAYYDQVFMQDQFGKPLNDQINANVAFIQNTGIMPKTLESQINTTSRTGSVEQSILAADQVARIQETTPQALKDMPADVRAILLQVGEAAKSGADPELALEAARKNAYGMTEAEEEAIKVKAKDYTKDLSSNLSTMLKQDFDVSPWVSPFSWAPEAPPAMEAEFRINFENNMVLTGGNSDQASRLAYESLKNVWGVSDITGGFMKYAPESVYGRPGEDNSWIADQFKEETAAYPDATIVVDASTARTPRPEYAIQVPNDQGIYEPLYDENNLPLVWTPDYEQTKEYKEFQAQPNVFEKAKMQRENNKKRTMNKKVKIINSKLRSQDLDTALNNALVLGEITEADIEDLRAYYADQD